MPRPSDWSPLNLSGDPTPGDPEAMVAVADYMATMLTHANTADTGLTQVITRSGEGAFVGKTADWLRETISTAVHDFIGGVKLAFQEAEPAVRSYLTAMREAQPKADAALTEAAGLAADDPRRATLTADANQAGTDLKSAATTAAATIRSAYGHIRSPNPKKSACEVFWEIFGWIVLAITVVAIFVGGPLGLIALGLNAIIAVKAVVDFASGKTNITGLVLGLLGLLGPSTKPLIALSTLKALAASTAKIIKTSSVGVAKAVTGLGADFWRVVSTITFSAVVHGVGDIAATIGKTISNGAIWTFGKITALDTLAIKGFVTLEKFVIVQAPAALGKFATTLGDNIAAGIRAVPDVPRSIVNFLGSSARWIGGVLSDQLGGWKWLKIFLPLNGAEIGVLGLKDAFKLAVLGRGLTMSRYSGLAIDFNNAVGAGVRFADNVARVNDPIPPNGTMVETGSGLVVPKGATDGISVKADVTGVSALPSDVVGGFDGTLQRTIDPTIRLDALGDTGSLANLRTVDIDVPPPVAANLGKIDTRGAVLLDPGKIAHVAADVQVPVPAPAAVLPDSVAARIDASVQPSLAAAPPAPSLSTMPAVTPLAGGSIGDATGIARAAFNRADSVLDTPLPEMRMVATGDVTAVRVSDSTIAFNLGRIDQAFPDSGFPAPQVGDNVLGSAHLGGAAQLAQGVPVPQVGHLGQLGQNVPTPQLGQVVDVPKPNLVFSANGIELQAATPPPVTGATAAKVDVPVPTGHLGVAPKFDTVGQLDPAVRADAIAHAATHTVVPPTMNPHVGDALGGANGGPVAGALRLLAEGNGVGPLGPLGRVDAASARFGDASTAGTRGSANAPELAGAPGVSGTMDNYQHAVGHLRAMQQHVSETRLNPANPLATVRAEKNVQVAQAVVNKAGAELKARGIDNPAQAVAEHAWSEFKASRIVFDQARATHDRLHPQAPITSDGASTSVVGAGKGKAPATDTQLAAIAGLDDAAVTFAQASERLDELGLDPAHLKALDDEATRLSLIERPRLLGGMLAAPQQVDNAAGHAVPGGRDLAGGMRLAIDAPAGGGAGQAGRLLDQHGAEQFRGNLVHLGNGTGNGAGNGGFRLVDPADAGHFREFSAQDVLVHSGEPVSGPGGNPLGRIEIYHAAGTATLHPAGGGAPSHFDYQAIPNGGGHQLTDATTGNWQRLDGNGQLTGQRFDVTNPTGQPAGHLDVNFTTNTATLHPAGGGAPRNLDYQAIPNGGGHQITDATTGNWQRLDANGQLTTERLGTADPNGQPSGHAEINHTANTATLHPAGGGAPSHFDYQAIPNGGGHQLTDATTGNWQRLDGNGQLTGQRFDVTNPTGQPAGHLDVNFTTNTATLHPAGGGAPRNLDYQAIPNGGGHQITDATTGNWQRLDANGQLTTERLGTADPNGQPSGHAEINHTANTATLHPAGGGAPSHFDYQAIPNGGGHQLTDATTGNWQRLDGNGQLTGQRFDVTNPTGQPAGHLDVNFTTNTATLHPAGGGAPRNLDYQAIPNGGGHQITDATTGNWQRLDANGQLTTERLGTADPNGQPSGHAEINHTANTATLHPAGGGAPSHFDYQAIPNGGGHQLTDATTGNWQRLDGNGQLTGQRFDVTNPTGQPAGHLDVNFTTNTATLHPAGGGAPRNVDYQAIPNGGGHQITDPATQNWQRFDGNGQLSQQRVDVNSPTGQFAGHLEIDFTTNTATLYRVGGGNPQNVAYQAAPNGGHQLTDPPTGNWQRLDANGQLTTERLGTADPNGQPSGHAEINHTANTATLHPAGGGAPSHFDYQAIPNGGGHQLTDATTGNWQRLDANGQLTGQRFDVTNPTGQPAGHLDVNFTTNTATLHRTGDPPRNVTYQAVPNGGGHQITDATTGNWQRFDGNGQLSHERTATSDRTGQPTGHLEIDYGAGTANLHPAGGGAPHNFDYQPAPTGTGHQITDAATGNWQRLDHNGRLVGEPFSLHTPAGQPAGHIEVDYVTNSASLHRPGGGNRGNFAYQTTPNGGHQLTDTLPGGHNGNVRAYGQNGHLVSEDLAFLNRAGGTDGTRLHIDYQTNTWTRVDATGNRLTVPGPTAARNANPMPRTEAYNSGGTLVVRSNGDIQLVGADRTPFYSRENLGDGHGGSLEVFREAGGKRYWHEWTGAGTSAGHGNRTFDTYPDGGVWSDKRPGFFKDTTVREYRKTADGGSVRAELQPGGNWHWYRFDTDGVLTTQGARFTGPRGWADVRTVDLRPGEQAVAQQYRSAWNWLGDAMHFREYPVKPRPVAQGAAAGSDGVRVESSYKEFSPQAKDTGSLETVSGGRQLEVTRYAEQRPPQSLWKTPSNVASWQGKAIARTIGSRYGAVDFPHSGAILGDSRFQVFTWTEKPPAGGGAGAAGGAGHTVTGVRTVTPEGSLSDFTRDGVFVRGTIKLDNGHTVEIGRNNADGKWASLNGNAPAAAAGRTLDWRELDSAKTVVDHGTRHFTGANGKAWTDVSHTGDVIRHSDNAAGDVVTFTAAFRPQFVQHPPAGGAHVTPAAGQASVTRNTMGQIIGRTDDWSGGGNQVTVTGHGDPKSGTWTWTDGTANGTRASGRNERWTGSWDDSYRDYTTTPGTLASLGKQEFTLVRDFRSLDSGNSLPAWRDAAGNWHSHKLDADGNVRNGTLADRQWKDAAGNWQNAAPPGKDPAEWRDVDPTNPNLVVRESAGGRVREYTNPRDHTQAPPASGQWKEFDFGGTFRTRTETAPNSGIFRESETFHKQWRETDAAGRLLRYRGLNGQVWERSPLGQWRVVGREFEFSSFSNQFRGTNRLWRETNRLQYRATDGLEGQFVPTSLLVLQKASLDFAQEFLMYSAAALVVTAIVNQGQFKPEDWAKIFVAGGVVATVKVGNTVMHDIRQTGLKGYKDGLANVDGGKDWNRNPYNNDKHWGNEWAGNETPPRWRSTTYDYFQQTILVGFLSGFAAGAIVSAAFGIGPNGEKLTGTDALLAGALTGAGSVLVGATFGGVKSLGHNLSSGRYFHRGSMSDLSISFAERLVERGVGTYLLNTTLGLNADGAGAPSA